MRKRIDEAAAAATDHAAQPKTAPLARPNTQQATAGLVIAFPPSDGDGDVDRLGTLIRHAAPEPPATIGTLPVTMIQTPFDALLMTPVSCAMLPAPRLTAALRAAISLPAIAARADPKHRPAIRSCGKTSAGEQLPHEPPSALAGGL